MKSDEKEQNTYMVNINKYKYKKMKKRYIFIILLLSILIVKTVYSAIYLLIILE